MAWSELADLKGPAGPAGVQGAPGAPGVNGIANDAAMATLVATPSSATATAMVTAVGMENIPHRIVIGSATGTPRPNWPGPVEWVTTVGDQIPNFAVDGDTVTVVSVDAFPWSPLMLPQLKSWYSASTAGVADGATVTTLEDLSSTGAALRQPVSTKRPLYQATGLNGKPGLKFDGVDDFMLSDTFVGRTRPSTTIFAVIGGGDAVNSSSRYAFDSVAPASPGGAFGRDSANKWVNRNGGVTTTSVGASDNGVRIVKIKHDATSTSIYVNAGMVAGPVANEALNTHTAVVWGSIASGAANFYNGLVGEFIELGNMISGVNEAKLYSYLEAKYGI